MTDMSVRYNPRCGTLSYLQFGLRLLLYFLLSRFTSTGPLWCGSLQDTSTGARVRRGSIYRYIPPKNIHHFFAEVSFIRRN